MYIEKVIIQNYRVLRYAMVEFNQRLNVIVGDNECGKSTLLEAIHLALSGQLNGRPIAAELHPYLFNNEAVSDYLQGLQTGRKAQPPSIVIEVYMGNERALAALKGTQNSTREDKPGIRFVIEYDEDHNDGYQHFISDAREVRTVPVEFYKCRCLNFAGNITTSKSIPLRPSFIDASIIRNTAAANRYVLDVVKESLTVKQLVALSLSYRKMKDVFLTDDNVKEINASLSAKRDIISNKELSVSLDSSARASWETGIMPHLDNIPLSLIGKGEQNSVKIKLAIAAATDANVFLIEEPENHLSFSNLNRLISTIAASAADKQLIITTHSSFVLNKLGIDNVRLFKKDKSITLKALTPETYRYFMKLPGHDTLRLILSHCAILVEGPSDELIVQKAYVQKYGKMPLDAGVDVIAVSSLAFKRFLEIANLLDLRTVVVTDNDGDIGRLQQKYREYDGHPHITVRYDQDVACKTLEPQMVKKNGLQAMNTILGTAYATVGQLDDYMARHKTECALKVFDYDGAISFPQYIEDAIA